MPKYKLWLPSPGETISWDDGGLVSFAAENAKEAFDFINDMWDEHCCWQDWMEDGVGDGWIHSEIASGRIVYKRDIDNEELLHEGAEPGETTFVLLRDDGRVLWGYEVRVWLPGPSTPGWRISPPGWPDAAPDSYTVSVGSETREFSTLASAEEGRSELVASWVQRWKAEHPECWSARKVGGDDA